jgi:hypothetical protein
MHNYGLISRPLLNKGKASLLVSLHTHGHTHPALSALMLHAQVDDLQLLVDPFNDGALTALEDAEEVLTKLIGQQARLVGLTAMDTPCTGGTAVDI